MAVLCFCYYFLQLFKKETCKNLPKCSTQHNYPKSTNRSLPRDAAEMSCPFSIRIKRIRGLSKSRDCPSCPTVRWNHFVLSQDKWPCPISVSGQSILFCSIPISLPLWPHFVSDLLAVHAHNMQLGLPDSQWEISNREPSNTKVFWKKTKESKWEAIC